MTSSPRTISVPLLPGNMSSSRLEGRVGTISNDFPDYLVH